MSMNEHYNILPGMPSGLLCVAMLGVPAMTRARDQSYTSWVEKDMLDENNGLQAWYSLPL